MIIYSNDEFLQKFQADSLDLVPKRCWLLRIEEDHYVVSFEPRNCTGESPVPFSMVEKVEHHGRFHCQGNGGIWMFLHKITLFIKKPSGTEAELLFEILFAQTREMSDSISCRGDCASPPFFDAQRDEDCIVDDSPSPYTNCTWGNHQYSPGARIPVRQAPNSSWCDIYECQGNGTWKKKGHTYCP